MFLQSVGTEGRDCHGHNCQLYEGPLDLLPFPPQVTPEAKTEARAMLTPYFTIETVIVDVEPFFCPPLKADSFLKLTRQVDGEAMKVFRLGELLN